MEKRFRFLQPGKHFASVALFIVLPLLVAAGLAFHTIVLEREKHLAAVAQQLEIDLAKIARESDTTEFVEKVARGAWYSVRRARNDQAELLSVTRSLQKFLPVDFDLYIFDEESRLISPRQIQLKSRFLGSRLWELLSCDPIEQGIRFQRLRRQLKAFLGNEFRMAQFVEGRDNAVQIIVKQTPGLIYWVNDRDRPGQGILMILWGLPPPDFRLKQTMKTMGGEFAVSCVVAGKNNEEITHFSRNTLSDEESAAIFRKVALMQQKNYLDEHGHIWNGWESENIWVIAAAVSGIEKFTKLQWFLHLALLLLALLAFFVYYKINVSSHFVPIRAKLLGLFLVAVLSPIMGFAYLGYRYLDDREATLVARAANQSRQLLVGFDESFRNVGESFINDFRELSKAATDYNRPEVRQRLEQRILSNDLITFELRNASNAEVIFAAQNELVFEGMREVSDAFSRFCLDNVFGSRLTASVDPLLDMAVRSPEAGLWFFFDRPDEVHRMSFGPVPMFIFWKIAYNASDASAIYVYILQSAARLTRRLVHSRLAGRYAGGEAGPFTLAAVENANGRWLPAKVRDDRNLREFAGRVIFADKPLETKMRVADEDYLLFGQRGKYLGDYSLFAFYPYRLIARELVGLKRQILAAMLLFVFLALLAGWLLAGTFIVPVNRLGDGVAAIKSRNADFRIETLQQDEFGDLAASFNHMIADLKEMQLARDVQESLLPAVPPALDGYQLSFANRMASAVGGDYFDIHVLDPENICILIGDVAGHGVSSALVMAMAKAVVYHGLKEKCDLQTLFVDLNLTVHSYFGAPPVRKMITVFAATLHLPSGRCEYANAGHNFPIMLTAGGVCNELASVHLPVGARQSLKNLKIRELQLLPGAALIFYTDGLVEVTDAAGQQYGYERLKNTLEKTIGQTAEAIVDRLMGEYDNCLAGREPDDDVTVVALRRVADV